MIQMCIGIDKKNMQDADFVAELMRLVDEEEQGEKNVERSMIYSQFIPKGRSGGSLFVSHSNFHIDHFSCSLHCTLLSDTTHRNML